VARTPSDRSAARPGGVPAAVPKAGLMTYKHCAGAEAVAVRASRRRVGDPRPVRGLHHLAQHKSQAYAAGGGEARSLFAVTSREVSLRTVSFRPGGRVAAIDQTKGGKC
jgi:hypothetical protein